MAAFDDVDTEHKRIKLLKDKDLYFEATKFVVGQKIRGVKQTRNNVPINVSIKDYAYQFPLRIMLKKIFELPDVYETVLTYVEKLKNEKLVIFNFIQSDLWNVSYRPW